MEIVTRHHDGDVSVKLTNLRTLRIPGNIFKALKSLRAPGEIMTLYMWKFQDFFVSGGGVQHKEWLKEWDSYHCRGCGHEGMLNEAMTCDGCGVRVLRRGITGGFEPFVSKQEYVELVCGLSPHFSRFDPSKRLDGTIFQTLLGANIRTTGAFIQWRDSIEGVTLHDSGGTK